MTGLINNKIIHYIIFCLAAIVTYKLLFSWFVFLIYPLILSFVLNFISLFFFKLTKKWDLSVYISMIITFILFLSIIVAIPAIIGQTKKLLSDIPIIIDTLYASNNNDGILAIFFNREYSLTLKNLMKDYIFFKANEFSKSTTVKNLFSIKDMVRYISILVMLITLAYFLTKEKRKIIYIIYKKVRVGKYKNTIATFKKINVDLNNYIYGKLLEIAIVSIVSYIPFYILELKHSFLLSLIVGLSVLIPYIGAFFVTIPIFIIGYYQYGFESELFILIVSYIIIQFLDGNILVPIIFSKVVALNPLFIIISIIFFGGTMGIIGVILAIPISIIIKNLLTLWFNTQLTIFNNQSYKRK